jgi:hypothetical protein
MDRKHARLKALAMQWNTAAPALRKARYANIRRQNNAWVKNASGTGAFLFD